MDVDAWLRGLGLGQYEDSFRDNEIDAEVLPHLTGDDLKELGVAMVGHRRKILAAIAALPSASTQSAIAGSSARADTAERRQITVMFCDLVGSTALSARLDPEDMSDLIRGFQSTVAAAAARFDGHVAKLMGDGTLLYFGYPQAHEDDAERAARAALVLVDRVRLLGRERDVALEIRIGVATGLVVVGELMGQGEARERGVIGDTPNLAARLQALAPPGAIVISAATRRLLGNAFQLHELEPQTIKGLAERVRAWTVVGASESVSRFEAARLAPMTPFVGREQEVALLIDRWRDATLGEGQVVLLSGEAGIGKSRILAALHERVAGEHPIILRYQCSPHHTNDAFYPIIGQIWQASGFVAGEPSGSRLDTLERMVAASGLKREDTVPYLASLLSVPAESRYPAHDMAPSDLKEQTVAALIGLFEALTRRAPVLALLEDVHWIDPTTLDVFSRLIDRLQAWRTLLVVTYRPEFVAPWIGRVHVTAHGLNRFGRRQSAAMIDRVTGRKALPAEVLDEIVAKTDGVPLFVEELTKTVLESGLLREEGDAYVLTSTLTSFAIPSTLQDSLMARLDRLGAIRDIAQIGAAIGREFSYRLLEAVSPLKGAALQDAMRQLVSSELIYGRGTPPEANYIFKHALVQDTAYGSLLRSRRQHIHADIARALVERFADQVDSAPTIIAHHYTEAGLAEPAARYWLASSEWALSRSANAEADRYVEAALTLIPRIDESAERRALELSLQIARSNALSPLNGHAEPRTWAALVSAKHLLDQGSGTDLQRFSVLAGLCAANFIGARMEAGLALARDIVDVADRQDDTTYRLVGLRMLASVLYFTGQNREALVLAQRAEQYLDPVRQKQLSYRFVVDPAIAILCYKALTLMSIGYTDQSIRISRQVEAELRGHGHALTIASCEFMALTWPELLFGELETSETLSSALVAYSTEMKIEHYRLIGVVMCACVRALRQPTAGHISAIRDAIDIYNQSGAQIWNSVFLAKLAEALHLSGDILGATETLQRAFAFANRSGERYWIAELHRLEGQIALGHPAPDLARAEACFLEGLTVADRQEARMLQLRIATDLARLWRHGGSQGSPRALLEPILAMVEGGDTLRDVRNARTLLAELA